jgi:hypothetical protein
MQALIQGEPYSIQILAFADDINIIGRTQKSMKEAFLNLKKQQKR